MMFIFSRGPFFLAGLLIGAAGSAWYFSPQSFESTPPPLEAASTSPAGHWEASGDVAVADQTAGNSVVVDSVTVPPPGVWLAVEDVNEDGSLGNVLGAFKVDGPRSNVSVTLLRATLPGHAYALVLYRDDGNGQFEYGKDSVYVDFDSGQPVEALFHTK